MAIRQKRSLTPGSIPTTSSLQAGELAINVPDGKLFLRKSGSGSDTIQSAITTGAQNSGSISLTGSLSIYNPSGNGLEINGDIFEISSDLIEFTGSFIVTGSSIVTGSLSVTNGITGSLQGTSSWAVSASQATTASYVLQAVSASFATSASRAVSSSFATSAASATTASYVLNAQTASFVTTAQTASYVLQAVSASFATTARTASYVLQAVSASFATTAASATTASYILNAVSASFATSAANATTASYADYAQTAPYVTGSGTTLYIPRWETTSRLGSSILYNSGVNVGLNATSLYTLASYSFLTLNNTTGAGIAFQANTTNIGRLFGAAGGVTLNVDTGNGIGLNINNSSKLAINSSGTVQVSGSLTVSGSSLLNGNVTLGDGVYFDDLNNRLGVGVSSPTQVLDVAAQFAIAKFTSTTGTNAAFFQYTNTGGNFFLGLEGSAGATFGASAYAGTIYRSGAYPIEFFSNGAKIKELKTTGQLRLNNYTSTTSFTGTAAGVLAFDSSGNILTIATPGGGSGSPGGANTDIQFNDGGAFGGTGSFTFNKATSTVKIQGSGSVLLHITGSRGDLLRIQDSGSSSGTLATISSGSLNVLTVTTSSVTITGSIYIDNGVLGMDVISAEPSAPSANTLLYYSKNVAGRIVPKILGPSGIDTMMQVALHGNSIYMVAPSNGTSSPTIWGGAVSTSGTVSHQRTIASSNPWQATRRTRFQTSTTAGNAAGVRSAYTQWFLGNAAGFGGFFFRAQLGMNINLNGGQKFVGLCSSTNTLGGNPSALTNMCGMGYDSGDASTGNWFFMRNDGAGTATRVDLGSNAARNTTHGYDLIMFVAPNSTTLYVRIVNLHSSVLVLDTSYTTDLPAVNTGLAFLAGVRNGAVAAADNIEIAKVYIETDF
jgi:hypothetical protein